MVGGGESEFSLVSLNRFSGFWLVVVARAAYSCLGFILISPWWYYDDKNTADDDDALVVVGGWLFAAFASGCCGGCGHRVDSIISGNK